MTSSAVPSAGVVEPPGGGGGGKATQSNPSHIFALRARADRVPDPQGDAHALSGDADRAALPQHQVPVRGVHPPRLVPPRQLLLHHQAVSAWLLESVLILVLALSLLYFFLYFLSVITCWAIRVSKPFRGCI